MTGNKAGRLLSALLAERRRVELYINFPYSISLSCRRRPYKSVLCLGCILNFYPLSLRRATNNLLYYQREKISITLSLESDYEEALPVYFQAREISIALLAESDFNLGWKSDDAEQFLSTLSLRRATTHPVGVLVRVIISIHALLAEERA